MFFSRAALLTLGSLAFTVFAAGCSSGVEQQSTNGAGGGSASGAGAGAGSTTSSGSGSGGAFDAGAPVTTIEKDMGPIAAQAGMENVQCITVNLKNAAGAFVRRFRAELGEGSHHMIVYISNKPVEEPTPVNCQSFSGILGGEHPIFIAQQAKADLVFPSDENGVPVGFEIQPNQMVKIEMHYIDTTPKPINVTGKILLDTVSLATKVIKSDLAFWGTKNINIPPNGTFDTGVKYQAALAGTKTFALTTHQHQLGTEMLVWHSTGKTDTTTQVADGKNWSDPPLELFSPALDFPVNGANKLSTKGLAFECKWKNTTASQVTFGEGFNNEMCFLWQYYYPSQGFQFCVDGFCKSAP